jgi:hypothetical protein
VLEHFFHYIYFGRNLYGYQSHIYGCSVHMNVNDGLTIFSLSKK